MCFFSKFAEVQTENFFVAVNADKTKQLTVCSLEIKNFSKDNFVILPITTGNGRLLDSDPHEDIFKLFEQVFKYGSRTNYEYDFETEEMVPSKPQTTFSKFEYVRLVKGAKELRDMGVSEHCIKNFTDKDTEFVVCKLPDPEKSFDNADEMLFVKRLELPVDNTWYAPIIYECDISDEEVKIPTRWYSGSSALLRGDKITECILYCTGARNTFSQSQEVDIGMYPGIVFHDFVLGNTDNFLKQTLVDYDNTDVITSVDDCSTIHMNVSGALQFSGKYRYEDHGDLFTNE